MTCKFLRAALAFALALPGLALAQHFEAVDTTPWPRLGSFPPYPPEPVPDTQVWARAGYLHDNNMFRLSKDANRQAILGTNDESDDVARVGIGARTQQRIVGR